MGETDARVTTVVISRDRRDQLLHSLGRHRPPVVLVDNGSTDGTVEAVREQLPHVQVVPLGENLGSPGRNVGVELARTPYVAFADDDSWWAEGSLKACADVFDQHPRVGLVAGRMLVGPDERLDPLCEVMAASPLPARAATPGVPILGFMACGAVVRREAFLEAGGFDPVTFFYGEEDRLAWDMAAAGWDLVYLDSVVAHHHPQQSAGRDGRRRLMTRNDLLTAVMRRPWPVVAAAWWRAARAGAEGRGGARDALPRLPAALRRRRRLPQHVEQQIRLLQA
jgi:GT2 family glycosyltransferase